jgi:predicted O-linked N-acetylglucosamine transferase (SPINDLY family)
VAHPAAIAAVELAIEHRRAGRFDDALAAYRQALTIEPRGYEVQYSFANFCAERGRFAEAIAGYRAALEANPRATDALNNLGAVQLMSGARGEAAETFAAVARIDPAHYDAAMNLAQLAFEAGRAVDAIAHYRRALQTVPESITARLALANALDAVREGGEALVLVRGVLQQAAGDLRVLCLYAHLQLRYCDWRDWERTLAALGPALDTAERMGFLDQVPASLFLMLPVAPGMRGRVAAAHARIHAAAAAASGWRAPQPRRESDGPDPARIRLGYLSGRFTADATGQLTVDLFPAHDRTRFHVSVLSFGPDDGSDYRRRIAAGADRFLDLGALTHTAAADAIAAAGIDILIDLDGFVLGARPQIAALRPAPLQLRYLDFPGTTAAPFFDYLVGDAIVTPPADQPLYAERLATLPGCYQVNAASQEAAAAPSRAACGLEGFDTVFCSFNTNTKIEPAVFALWMEILGAVPGSALWLLGESELGARNLREAARARGIDPQRLVFAGFVPRAQHLARIAHADLFLDTLVYNAHTTASDALWAGVPVLTLPGDSFASRVGASLVTAAGLPELVAQDRAHYKALAVELAQDRARLAGLRARLAQRGALYDTGAFVKRLEALYEQMWARHIAGEPPAPIGG